MEQVNTRTAEKDWVNILFLSLTPVVGIVGTAWYTIARGFEPWMLMLMLGMYLLVGLSICAGYHRFFSHKSYECSRPVQYFYAIFGALAAQNSILWWSSSHRVHHSYVDKDWDPYNIKRGFAWAHIFWIFYRNPSTTFDNATDLQKNPVVMWQHRWHKVILVVVGFGLPTLIGALMGDAIAGLLWGGFTRIVVIHHTTFFVNSLAHFVGRREFDANVSARDNWMVALLTLGEGYHSFHHRFPVDFRNGIRWYHWDPAKWFIQGLKAVGLADDLRTVPAPMIEKARMQAAMQQFEERLDSLPQRLSADIRARVARAREALEHAAALWREHTEQKSKGLKADSRRTRRHAHSRVKVAKKEWRKAVRMLGTAQAA